MRIGQSLTGVVTNRLRGVTKTVTTAGMEEIHPLKAYRNARKLTQDQLAEKLGFARTSIARWETGRKIDLGLVPKITAETGIPAKVLRPDLAELLATAPAEAAE